MIEAVILDGEQRSALAATRSLGGRGLPVVVGSDQRRCLSSRSRYCHSMFRYPSPSGDPRGFVDAVAEQVHRSSPVVLVPMTDVTLSEVLRNRNRFGGDVRLPFVDYEKYLRVTDKGELFRSARRLKVPMPRTLISDEFGSREHLIREAGRIGYPVVVKPCFSKIRGENGWTNAGVRYAPGDKELERILSEDVFRKCPFLVQEKVVGPGVGVFLLMEDGRVLARFSHKRIREKPPSGGVSVLCESIEPPEDALEAAMRILTDAGWTGVAMVEFKLDRKERDSAKLIEVNGRFWGSLELAVASGVDFPYYLYRMALGEPADRGGGYRTGLKSRWELGDLDHLLIRLSRKDARLNLPPGHPSKGRLVLEFIADFLRPSVRNEVFHGDDMMPFFHELSSYMRALVR